MFFTDLFFLFGLEIACNLRHCACRWHRQVLAEEQARRHLGIYPAPRRRSGFVLNAVESTSDAPAIPRRRSGLVLSSADGGIHPSISSGLDRLVLGFLLNYLLSYTWSLMLS